LDHQQHNQQNVKIGNSSIIVTHLMTKLTGNQYHSSLLLCTRDTIDQHRYHHWIGDYHTNHPLEHITQHSELFYKNTRLMKKLYLAGAVITFSLIAIIYFENVARGIQMMFFGSYKTFTGVFPILIALWIIEGACITLLVQSRINDVQDKIDSGWIDL